PVEETSRGAVTRLGMDVGDRERVWVKLCDYAGNVSVIEIGSEPISFLKGDCDLNGTVDSVDALLALRHALGIIELEGPAFLAGDIDGNGVIDSTDALFILRYALEIIHEL
ncbi:MAG: dockerin type I repeat-containing protein, partial [Clostridia bacterium]|nr:dockerin type I repeat-containing protein [Clostridia bacterium]